MLEIGITCVVGGAIAHQYKRGCEGALIPIDEFCFRESALLPVIFKSKWCRFTKTKIFNGFPRGLSAATVPTYGKIVRKNGAGIGKVVITAFSFLSAGHGDIFAPTLFTCFSLKLPVAWKSLYNSIESETRLKIFYCGSRPRGDRFLIQTPRQLELLAK